MPECATQNEPELNTSRFYFEFKGHTIPDVDAFRSITPSLRPDKPIIYLAGDSSLDNKYWVPTSSLGGVPLPVDVPEIYGAVLDRPPKPDVAFWLNHFLGDLATALNLAVEASTLHERNDDLLDHDRLIRDNIRAGDVLIVSVGSNDIAMRPTFSTNRHMLQLAWLAPHRSIDMMGNNITFRARIHTIRRMSANISYLPSANNHSGCPPGWAPKFTCECHG